MRTGWGPEDFIDCWTLVEDNWRLVGNKTGATRLGFSVMLKHFELEGRFPEHAVEIPQVVVDYVASQVKVDPSRFAQYDWAGRTGRYHRAQIGEWDKPWEAQGASTPGRHLLVISCSPG
jgi:hypothetical protein